ncbi:APC family permease [Agromyces sp. NPDC058126]|uniref:APC family permease n=1 Tax=Agromyces sp. NPDC058126 TaxID=3346350 RepID=UPI0036DA6108
MSSTPTPTPTPTADDRSGGLARGKLGTFDIFFFVVAAAAPLAVMAGAAPLAFRLGGIGAPGAYLFSGIVYILCAAGFTAFARYVRNAGAFYAFIGRGLGRSAGGAAALVALLSYALICAGFYGFLGFYAATTFNPMLGIELHWSVYALAGLAVVAVLGYRQIDIGARVLAVLMILEVLILAVIAVAVLATEGTANFSIEPFAPGNVFNLASGGMFVLALGAFIGFESTAIYAEEARRPERTVPRATYFAVGFLAVFYAFIAWIAVAALGVDGLVEYSLSDVFQGLYFMLAESYLGTWASIVMGLLIVTSILAATIAFHNATSRYLFSLGRDGFLPARLGVTHSCYRSPARASLVTTIVSLMLISLTVTFGADPYLVLLLWTNGVGIVGVVALQAVCMVAVIRFFSRDRRGHGVFRVLVAPLLGVVGLLVGLVLMVTNLELLTGRNDWVNWALMLSLVVAAVVGVLRARRLGAAAGAEGAEADADAVPSDTGR